MFLTRTVYMLYLLLDLSLSTGNYWANDQYGRSFYYGRICFI